MWDTLIHDSRELILSHYLIETNSIFILNNKKQLIKYDNKISNKPYNNL